MKKDAIVPFLIAAMFVIAMSVIFIKNYNGNAGEVGELAIDFTTDGEAALAQAKEEGKLIMIDFYADWCGPCKQMERQAFTDESVADLLKDVIALRVDVDHPGNSEELYEKYASGAIPLIVFLDSDGEEIGRSEGYGGVSAFKKDVRRILSKA